jgi:hypothetical protein
MLFFLPVALVLNFAKLEPFHRLTWEQVGLIVGKGRLAPYTFSDLHSRCHSLET